MKRLIVLGMAVLIGIVCSGLLATAANVGHDATEGRSLTASALTRLLELEKKKLKSAGELKLIPGEYIPDEVLIKMRDNPDKLKAFRWKQNPDNSESLDETLKKLKVSKREPLFRKQHRFNIAKSARLKADQNIDFDSRRHQRLRFSGTKSLKTIIETLQKHPLIEYAEPNYIRNPIGNALPSTATDPYYQQQWHLAAINAPQAWQFLADHNINPGGSSDVVIAVIDTGVDYTHPDLAGNMWINTGEIPGNGVDDDGNGFVDDVYGANVVINSGDPQDDHGHGTHVAGIACAQGNNGIGGVGVAL